MNTPQTVAFLLAGVVAVVTASHIAEAGPRFDPKMAKGGLPVCMEKLQNAAAELEAAQENILQVQADLVTCKANASTSLKTVGVPRTGQTYMYVAGDDGELQMGVPLPDPRFIDNVDGTVTDNLTGLIWTKDANLSPKSNWADALDLCYNLADDGLNLTDGSLQGDWRLPNIRELQSMFDYGEYYPTLTAGHPFINLPSSYTYYWTSTTYAALDQYAWGLSFFNGYISPLDKGGRNGYVWCVHGGN